MNLLENPIIHPIFQIIITFVLCSGILNFGRIINNLLFKSFNYNFFNLSIGSIIISQIIFTSFLIKTLNPLLTLVSIFLVTLGLINLKFFVEIKSLLKKLIKSDNKTFLVIATFFLIFFIISLAPPSMTDALDYHYGVPLNIIKFSNFPNQDAWLSGSLFGYSEMLNIIPLNLKTDNFFSFFQLLSLVFFFEYFYKKKINANILFYSILFIICSPVFLFLISGPKALLFPQLLTAMALYLFVKNKKYDRRKIIFISILLISATQFKLSFILSGAVIGVLILIKIFKNDKITILNLALITCLIFSPKIFYNYNQVSPFEFLNILTTTPKYVLDYLVNFKDNNFYYPLNLFIPSSIGHVSTILGFQLIILFLLKKVSKNFKKILVITLFSIILHFIFGQQTSRIYFEFIIWISVGLLFLKKNFLDKKYFYYILTPQLIFIFISSLYFAINTIPTLLDLEQRNKFMQNNTYEFSGIEWVNKNIPNNTTLISNLRSISLFTNRVIPHEDLLNYSDKKERYINLLKSIRPNFYVTKQKNTEYSFLKNCLGNLYKESNEFSQEKRNPFGNTNKYKIYIYIFNYENLNFCANLEK